MGEIVFYGSLLDARKVADRFGLALLEPPLDLLVCLPPAMLLRRVEYCRWSELGHFSRPVFLKPADPLAKVFDAGVYRERGQIRAITPIPAETPVLMAEPVEWMAEYRCFVLDGQVVAASPYLSFGRPLQHHATGAAPPAPVVEICHRLLSFAKVAMPPAFVVDVGLLDDRGWAVVEFNPAWCSGLLSADPVKVLDVLKRSCRRRTNVDLGDRRWVLQRGRQ